MTRGWLGDQNNGGGDPDDADRPYVRKPVTVVLKHEPGTVLWDEDWGILDVHGGESREGDWRTLSDAEWTREFIDGVGLPDAIWEKDDVPEDVKSATKVLVVGHMETWQSGNTLDGFEDECQFEVESYRVLA